MQSAKSEKTDAFLEDENRIDEETSHESFMRNLLVFFDRDLNVGSSRDIAG